MNAPFRLPPGRAEGEIVVVADVNAVMAMVGLNAAHLERYSHELSGGQRQRAAIARAIICEPEILVLDEALEPFSPLRFHKPAEMLEAAVLGRAAA